MDEDRGLMSATEAAAYLGVTRQSMLGLAKRNGLGKRIGNAWVFTREELDTWVAKPRPQGGRPPKSFVRVPSPVALAR